VLIVYFVINSITALLLIILSLVVLTRNSRTELNKSFAAFTFFVALWVLSNHFSNLESLPIKYVTLANHSTLLFSCLSLVVLSHFLMTFVRSRLSKLRNQITIISTVLALTALTPFVIKNVEFKDGVSVIEFGALTPVYFGVFALSIAVIFYSLVTGLRYMKGFERKQIRAIFIGALVTVGLSSVTNAVLPAAFGYYSLISVGPLSTLALIYALFYTITKHRLFDIKRAVARGVAYLLSLGFIGVVYGGLIFVLSLFLTADSQFDNIDRAIYIILALLSAVLFAPTKRFFDKLTNTIFYRDAYDPQQFLDELNSAIVQNIELGILLRRTTATIQQNLKSEFCFIEIKATETNPKRLAGTGGFKMLEAINEEMRQELRKTGKTTVVTDELGGEFSRLRSILSDHSIAVLVRIMPGNDPYEKAPYYLMLGEKKSGNVYDNQDIRIINIVADELLIAIQNALRFEEIQAFNITLQKRINDATAKLKRSNEKLKEMDETKDEFISMASHQLRTPLTSVKGYLSMVLDGDAGKVSSAQKELLNQAFVSSQRMVYLIADLLNVSRLKTGKFIIEQVPTNLAEMVESEIAQLKEVAKGRKLSLEFDKPKDFPVLMIDETKTRQVVMNFVDNAIYYTPADGNIKIELKTDRHSVYFMVKDDGMGVPKQDQAHLFSKFYRAKNAQKARPDGTGLGLFMAKKVINEQGGCILFESAEGKGSTFGFKFDRPKEDQPTTQPAES
jgi:signal transduction histidine kinase